MERLEILEYRCWKYGVPEGRIIPRAIFDDVLHNGIRVLEPERSKNQRQQQERHKEQYGSFRQRFVSAENQPGWVKKEVVFDNQGKAEQEAGGQGRPNGFFI